MKRIAVLPGDGIGPEVMTASLSSFDALGLKWETDVRPIGWECWREHGTPVPNETWSAIETADAALLGAITSKPEREARAELSPNLDPEAYRYVSPVIQLRQRLGLFANVRPVTDLREKRYDFAVLRENTEGLYAGFDDYPVDAATWDRVNAHPNARVSGRSGTAATIRLQTIFGVERHLRYGFSLADRRERKHVTIADKPNVLRQSSRMLREIVERIADEYPSVAYEILNVDAVALWMVTRPERFGVIVAENMFGDILSDLGAGIMGGLGLASSSNVGDGTSYFEPVHGSAPRLAGKGQANPIAMFLTIASLVEHLGANDEASALRAAVRSVVSEGSATTYDLGGHASTEQCAQAVLGAIR